MKSSFFTRRCWTTPSGRRARIVWASFGLCIVTIDRAYLNGVRYMRESSMERLGILWALFWRIHIGIRC